MKTVADYGAIITVVTMRREGMKRAPTCSIYNTMLDLGLKKCSLPHFTNAMRKHIKTETPSGGMKGWFTVEETGGFWLEEYKTAGPWTKRPNQKYRHGRTFIYCMSQRDYEYFMEVFGDEVRELEKRLDDANYAWSPSSKYYHEGGAGYPSVIRHQVRMMETAIHALPPLLEAVLLEGILAYESGEGHILYEIYTLSKPARVEIGDMLERAGFAKFEMVKHPVSHRVVEAIVFNEAKLAKLVESGLVNSIFETCFMDLEAYLVESFNCRYVSEVIQRGAEKGLILKTQRLLAS